jgi:hypothetical protein
MFSKALLSDCFLQVLPALPSASTVNTATAASANSSAHGSPNVMASSTAKGKCIFQITSTVAEARTVGRFVLTSFVDPDDFVR